MSIPFVRQFPNGRRGLSEVSASDEAEGFGREFVASGGVYLCEILPDGKARLAACLRDGEQQRDVEEEIADNGPALIDAVERLLRNSVNHVRPGA